ncbi:MAG: ligase-associated DNA damage response exonuclease [Cohaesibacteraceae bacterium]|nr:ligase-associated DNA damage response exonuclease [Cohaesibacteraceae bacterium]
MIPSTLLVPKPEGLYCPPGDFYIDPVKRVDHALITHGHSDHARKGHTHVMATAPTLAFMRARYGANFARQSTVTEFGTAHNINGVDVSFHPAGHVLGSAQIRLSMNGMTIVASGDYKREPDPASEDFEVVPCDVFITEATFALPIFRHPPALEEINKLIASVNLFPDHVHVVGAYSLGKTQRVLGLLRSAGYEKPIYIADSAVLMTQIYADHGIEFGDIREANKTPPRDLIGAIIVGPHGKGMGLDRPDIPPVRRSFASGWLSVKSKRWSGNVDFPLVISDHCDWDELCTTIRETGAREIWVTHGSEAALIHWCRSEGLTARPLHLVGYDGEDQ